ncbi:MAG: helix-turn-helix transcriptional regulator [Crenarchaeota archaeon]|nr:helix-turn-helix transcriptional regulator [Thermoproteota archaeon]
MSHNNDPLIQKIIALLTLRPEGYCFTDFVRLLHKPKETINRRLKLLVNSGIVEKKRVKNKVIYRLRSMQYVRLIYFSIQGIFLDYAKLIIASIRYRLFKESAVLICLFSKALSSYILGTIQAAITAYVSRIKDWKNEYLSDNEIINRLIVQSTVDFYGPTNIFQTLPPLIVIAAYELSKHENINIPDLSKIKCNDISEDEELDVLNKLSLYEPDSAKRLLEIWKLRNKTSLDLVNEMNRIYKDVSEKLMESFDTRVFELLKDHYGCG